MIGHIVMAALLASTGALAQNAGTADEVTITIMSPEPDSYAAGTVQLKAAVAPGRRVKDIAKVMFYVNGRLECTIMEPTRLECPWDAGAHIREHVIRAVVEMHGGARAVTSMRTKSLELAEAVRVEVTQVTAVVHERGRFIKGLPLSAFRLLEDNARQKITHFSAEGSPLELVIAVDVSESMTQAMPQLKNSVKKFLSALGPKDQVTLTAFNDNMFTLTRRDTTPAQRLRAVDRLAPWGGTALYDVIIKGLQQLLKQPGRRVLVVFTDGDDKSSHSTLPLVEQAVRSSDATLFMVALGSGVRNATIKSSIERLVDLSGGRALFVERSDLLDGPFAEIVEELSNQYLIGYESTNTKRDGTWREIRIELPEHRYSVRARQGYNAPKK
ncbi:MAG TPA: VWA domain-containing protein [Vicinamibacterales bacterium]|nr:VWA domain-containing protein [Vicinamibacterales bacterium]